MNREDVAHYEAPLVMQVARTLARRKGKKYDDLSDRVRRATIETAIDVVADLINNDAFNKKFQRSRT